MFAGSHTHRATHAMSRSYRSSRVPEHEVDARGQIRRVESETAMDVELVSAIGLLRSALRRGLDNHGVGDRDRILR